MMPPRASRLATFAAWLLLATQLVAATKTWTGNAAAVVEIKTITVGGTCADAETATITINGKSLVLTLVGTESTANVAIAIKEMWMAGGRLDGTGTTDATSNAGGAAFGEFAEVSATVSGSVVTLICETPGKPFTVSVSETFASGTLTLATVQAATGPNFWDNPKNWSSGSVPANNDTVVFRDSDVSCKYNLPAIGVSDVEVTAEIHATYRGELGLRRINRDNPSLPYYEYRTPRVPEFGYGGAGTSITHRVGIGSGPGSKLIKLSHTGDGSLTVGAIVYKTDASNDLSERALQLELYNSTAVGTVSIFSGQVALSPTQLVGTLKVIDGDVLYSGNSGNLAVEQSGGKVEQSDEAGVGGTLALSITGGSYLSRLRSASGNVSATVEDASLEWSSDVTLATLEIRNKGVVVGDRDLRALTITNCDLYAGAALLMGNGRAVTYTNGIDLNRTDVDGVKVQVGTNKRLSLSTVP